MDKAARDELKSRAEKAKRKRSTMDTCPPVVLEFAGSPKSGKSTCIDIVSHFFKRTGFKIWAPTEGASKRTPYHLKRDLVAFNTWSLNYAISELLVAYHNVDQPDLVMLDRGPFDSIAWMSLLKERKVLDDAEFRIVKDFALHPKWSALISRIYLFTCDPEKSLERETGSKLTAEPGIAMNTDTLTDLLAQYSALADELEQYPIKRIDTTETKEPLPTAHEIAEDVLGLFEA